MDSSISPKDEIWFLRVSSHFNWPLVQVVDSSWNVMAHGDAREGKWRRNWRMKWVASTLRTTSEHGVSSITTADAHTSAASSRLNWCPPADLNGLVRFARKKKCGFCVCAITFQTQSTTPLVNPLKLAVCTNMFNTKNFCILHTWCIFFCKVP